MSEICAACGAKALSCEDCQSHPQDYVSVKDAWLADRSLAHPGNGVTVPVEWAIGDMPGGLVATWDHEIHKFLGNSAVSEPARHRFGWLELTTACPQRCRHCYLGKRLAHGHASLAMILQALSQMREFMVQEVVVTGGEPTMHPHFADILNKARELATVRVLTNGWTQRPDVIHALAQPGVKVETPLLGWQDDHDWMTQTPGSFARVMTSLRRYHEAGIDLTLTTTLTRYGIQALPQLRQVADELGIPFVPSALTPEGAAVDHWGELFPIGNGA